MLFKNFIIKISIIVILLFGLIVGWILFQKGKLPPEEEVVPEKEETTSEVLEKLTPKELKPMTKEEQKELEELLKQLTP